MLSSRRCILIVLATAVAGCSRAERQAERHAEPQAAVAMIADSTPLECAVGSASTFVGDTTLFGVRNECGRWTATPAQRDSSELFTGFRDSVEFALPDCPAGQPVDSLIFGTIHFSDETGDASGSQLVFQRRGAWLRGIALEGAGGISPPISLRGLSVGPGPSQLTFWVPSAQRTIILYSVSLSCTRVEGSIRFRNFADARYDDGSSLSEPISVTMTRSAKATTEFP